LCLETRYILLLLFSTFDLNLVLGEKVHLSTELQFL
jgi:hypothetical protein